MATPNFKKLLQDLLEAGEFTEHGDFIIKQIPFTGDRCADHDHPALRAAWDACDMPMLVVGQQ